MPGTTETEKAKPGTGAVETPEKKAADSQFEERAANSFLNSLINGPDTEEKPPEGEDDPNKAVDGKKPDAKPPEKPAKPDKKKKRVETPAPALSAENIIAAASEGATRALAHQTKKEEPDTTKPEAQFPEAEQRRISVLRQMEKTKGDKYRGVADKYIKSLQTLIAYADDWKAKNPGKEFNEDDSEHDEFFKKNDVPWEDDDYTEGLAELKAEQVIGSQRKEIDEKYAKLERHNRYTQSLPKVRANQIVNARSFYSDLGEDYKDILPETGIPNQEILTKLNTENPVGLRIAINGADTIESYASQTYALFNDLVEFDPKNQVHVTISNFVLAKEQQMMKKPVADCKSDDGRDFITAKDYWSLPPDKQKNFWTFNCPEVDAMLRSEIVGHTKKQIQQSEDQFAMTAKARGITLPEKTAKKDGAKPKPAAKKPEEAEEEEVEAESTKPRSPSAGSPAIRTNGAGAKPEEENEPVKTFSDRFLGKT